jgi:hypothetical protein
MCCDKNTPDVIIGDKANDELASIEKESERLRLNRD